MIKGKEANWKTLVQVLLCSECAVKAKRGEHVNLHGTPTSLIYGCKHAIRDVKRETEEEVKLLAKGVRSQPREEGIQIIRYTKIEFKGGKLKITGNQIPKSKLKMLEDFRGW